MISKNQIKFIQSLHLKKYRQERQLFIAEGIKVVNEFIQNPDYCPKELFATKAYIEAYKSLLTDKPISVYEVSEDELKKISQQNTPNQVLALCPAIQSELDINSLTNQLTLFLDDIRDPGNLGTIIRLADWFGVRQVICSPSSVELYNPKTIQASMGAILRVRVIYMPFETLLLSSKGVPVYGAVLNGTSIYHTPVKNGILVIGNEANGISGTVLAKITHPVTIPATNQNGSESLNAAMATAILLNEHNRFNLIPSNG